MKSVLVSVQPIWCVKIANIIGQKNKKPIYEKSVEIRKTKPKIETPFKCYIYCTKGYVAPETDAFQKGWRGYVIGEFICDEIQCLMKNIISGKGNEHIKKASCLTGEQLNDYAKGGELYAWHISDLVIYNEPKELSEFEPYCDKKYLDGKSCKHYEWIEWYGSDSCIRPRTLTRAPQSWCYVKEQSE